MKDKSKVQRKTISLHKQDIEILERLRKMLGGSASSAVRFALRHVAVMVAEPTPPQKEQE